MKLCGHANVSYVSKMIPLTIYLSISLFKWCLCVRAKTISECDKINKFKLLISLHSSKCNVQLSPHVMSAEGPRKLLHYSDANSTQNKLEPLQKKVSLFTTMIQSVKRYCCSGCIYLCVYLLFIFNLFASIRNTP